MNARAVDPVTGQEVESFVSPLGGYKFIAATDLKPGEVRWYPLAGVIRVGKGEGVDVITKPKTLDQLRAEAAALKAAKDAPKPVDPDEERKRLEAEIAALSKAQVS